MFLRPFILSLSLASMLPASEALDRAHKFEDAGDSVSAREVFKTAIRQTPNDAELRNAYGEFQERYHGEGARAEYRKAASIWKADGKTQQAAGAERRAVLLDLIAGDRISAESDLAVYKDLGGTDLQLPAPVLAVPGSRQMVTIPGPLRSFARMAAFSPDSAPDDVMPALARNVVMNGYQAARSNDELEETEYLKLVHRYISQARELSALAGSDHVIKVPNCDSSQTNDLLRVLGYRIRGGCGSEVVLETVNAARAFITTDSGFPLAQLEQSLRTDKPFSFEYKSVEVPMLYGSDYWVNPKDKSEGEFIDAFLSDPGLCRFYLGMSKLDPETADALKAGITQSRLRAFAGVLDFFGGNFEIRDGKAVVPGGAKAAATWAELAGASPDKGAEFFDRLMTRDDGWLASMYDALARIHGPVQDYLTDSTRMKRFYAAIRGKVTTPGPARPVFRSNADMMLLTTRLRIDPDGKAHIPGGMEVWRVLFAHSSHGKYDAKLTKTATAWKDPDDVLEALFALCRKPVDNEALKMFMALTDIDRNRSLPLEGPTVDHLVRDWNVYGSQYSLFADVPSVSDQTIVAWLNAAEALDKIRDPQFRLDSIGMMQGLSGLWQIFCRQGSIPAGKADETLAGIAAPFPSLKSDRELFDAGRAGLNLMLKSAGATGAGTVQDRILAMLAGGAKIDESDSRTEMVRDEQRIFEAQKLLPADLVFELSDNLEGIAKGEKLNAQLASRLSARVADIQLPRNSMTGVEKNALAFGYFVDRHIDEERKLNFRALIDKASKDPEKLKDIRGQLAPTLRDTIVGYNYIHYAPPGAQILMTNPLFVRGHDFIGMQGSNRSWRTTEMYGTGWPSNAGGRLVGSLSGLAYALAEAEQNFLVPTQTQALIWGDLVPQMMLAAKAPRFWSVTPVQMHWVGMNMRFAESEVAEASANPAHRETVFHAVDSVSSPWRAALVRRAITAGDAHEAIGLLTPAEMYSIARTISAEPDAGPEAREIAHYRSFAAEQVSAKEISKAWGTPKPTLSNSYSPELLNLRTFPTLMGYSSRIMAESWESNSLYWADVGDEIGARPAQLNVLVPEWTEKVVERIFASHLEDWPALLKSLRSVGDEVRGAAPAAVPDKTIE